MIYLFGRRGCVGIFGWFVVTIVIGGVIGYGCVLLGQCAAP